MRAQTLRLSWLIGVCCMVSACNDAAETCAGRSNVFAGSLYTTPGHADEELEQVRCAEVVTGNLTVDGATSLHALSSIVQVQGDLQIRFTDQLRSLAGLENLQQVDGNLSVRSHEELDSLDALASLTVVGGSLDLQGLPRVSDLTGLEALREIGGDFTLRGNASLVDLASLTSLERVEGRLTIADAPALRSLGIERPWLGGLELDGADSLQKLDLHLNFRGDAPCTLVGDETVVIRDNALLREVDLSSKLGLKCVGIYNNPELASLARPRRDDLVLLRLMDLPNLEQVDCAGLSYSTLEIVNTGLRTLAGFSGTHVRCKAWIAHNPNLEDLGEFAKSPGLVRTSLEVHDNPKLPICEVEQMIDALPQGLAVCANSDSTNTSRLLAVENNDDEGVCE